MTPRRLAFGVAAAVAVVAALALFAYRSGALDGDAGGTSPISGSYAFDVEDKRQLMAYADEVFVADVEHVERVDEEAASTVWSARIIRSIKGDRSGWALVRQLGYVDEDGLAHVPDEQALLQPGRRYLLVTTRDRDVNTLVAGPASAVAVDDSSAQARVVREYRAALR